MEASDSSITFSEAAARSAKVRGLYHELESRHHGAPWSKQEDMVGFLYEVGELGRLLMAAEGRWVVEGDGAKQLENKLGECFWWLFSLSGRLGIDASAAFSAKLEELEAGLEKSVEECS